MLDRLDTASVRAWAELSSSLLELHRDQIDDLNVFPVPDGDTGTNLSATLSAATAQLVAGGAEVGDAPAAAQVLARAAVLSARGNSGVIVSQILCGLAEGIGTDAGVAGVVAGLRRAFELALQAVGEPVPGTMLSVIEAAADAADAADAAAADAADAGNTRAAVDLSAVVVAAVVGAEVALHRTPEQLPVLARAGVVDAGGWGVVLVLDALAQVITGRAHATRPPRRARSRQALISAREHQASTFAFEVQYLLETDPEMPATDEAAVAGLRAELGRLGDSVVVAGTGDGRWNVHVHLDDAGAAIEAALEVGRPSRITVVSFAEQLGPSVIETAGVPAAPSVGAGRTALIAIAPGAGLHGLLEAEGVIVLADNDADAVLALIEGAQLDRLILLPNAVDVEQLAVRARQSGIEAAVIPTRSPLQALAAVAVHDAGRRFEDDVIAMAEAAAATRFAEIRVADRDALTTIGPCRAGDVLGLIDGEVVQIGRSVGAVTLAVTDRLLGTGGELITVLLGEDSAEDAGEALRRHVGHVAPLTEVVIYPAGQLGVPLLIGME